VDILVTGGAGYIGSHTCKALAKAGFQPVVIDNLETGHLSAVKWGPFVEGDVSDQALVDQVLADYQIQAVIHFAAYAYVGESMNSPDKYFANNVSGTLVLLDALLKRGIASLVFSSTCATYGAPSYLPIDEAHPQQPVNPYGDSKLFVERILNWYGQAFGLRSIALRYFNAAGADAECEIGENHDPETHLIPLVIQAAMGLREHIDVFGTDFATQDGTAIRDYIHVEDLASAHVRALQHLLGGGSSLQLNLGTGRGYSVREVIDAVQAHSGREVASRDCDRRPGDPAELVANAGRAHQLLDWEPRHSSLQNIVATAWRWHEMQLSEPLPGASPLSADCSLADAATAPPATAPTMELRK
jgi:UDP-glucose-4-epimerase GalE